MILEIALGIILAFFIMGLLEDIPSEFWPWFWLVVVILVAPQTTLRLGALIIIIVLVGLLYYFLKKMIVWIKNRTKPLTNKKK